MSTTTLHGTGADAVVQTLVDRGVDTVFGMCGHGVLSLLDAMRKSGIRFISVHHEQVAVHAADAYFRTSGRVGVVLTTVAAGMLNTVTALSDALLDSSAVLVISGGVPSRFEGLGAYQEIEQHGTNEQSLVSRPLVKRSFQVTEPLSLAHVVARAFHESTTGNPGPVHVHVPLDFFATIADYRIPAAIGVSKPALSAAVAAQIIHRLAAARRPVAYFGGGVTSSGARDDVVRFAEAVDIPVVTSMLGQGILPENHPLALGFTGVVGTRPANHAVRNADVVIAIGTRFDEMDTSSWRPDVFIDPDKTEVIQIDIDALQLGRHYETTIAAVADASLALAQLADLAEVEQISHETWRTVLAEVVGAWDDEIGGLQSDTTTPLQAPAILKVVRDELPDDAVLVSGAGVRHLIGQHYSVNQPATMLVASGGSTMGWETAATIGAKVAAPDRIVVGVIGDGAFNSTVSSLATAVAYGVNVLWIILDNGGYQSIAAYQDRHFGARLGTDFVYEDGTEYAVDYLQLAAAYGAEAEHVDSLEELRDAIKRGIECGGNYLIHVPTHNRPRPAASGSWDVNPIMSGADVTITPAPYAAREN